MALPSTTRGGMNHRWGGFGDGFGFPFGFGGGFPFFESPFFHHFPWF